MIAFTVIVIRISLSIYYVIIVLLASSIILSSISSLSKLIIALIIVYLYMIFILSDSGILMMNYNIRVSDNEVIRWNIAQTTFFYQNTIKLPYNDYIYKLRRWMITKYEVIVNI